MHRWAYYTIKPSENASNGQMMIWWEQNWVLIIGICDTSAHEQFKYLWNFFYAKNRMQFLRIFNAIMSQTVTKHASIFNDGIKISLCGKKVYASFQKLKKFHILVLSSFKIVQLNSTISNFVHLLQRNVVIRIMKSFYKFHVKL